jgi:hypothetical protein
LLYVIKLHPSQSDHNKWHPMHIKFYFYFYNVFLFLLFFNHFFCLFVFEKQIIRLKIIWEMFNCSNYNSSKKLVNTKIQLLHMIQAYVKKSQKSSALHVIIIVFEQFHLKRKIELQLVDKSYEKCKLLNTIYS